jgi:hypothetical protein
MYIQVLAFSFLLIEGKFLPLHFFNDLEYK